MQSGSRAAQQELAATQDLLYQVDRYVDASLEELDRTSSQVRQSLDDEREKLIAEKNGLPWE
jgi:ABC-type transporter Mla subunit MlaD